jgi:hypothetical protein
LFACLPHSQPSHCQVFQQAFHSSTGELQGKLVLCEWMNQKCHYHVSLCSQVVWLTTKYPGSTQHYKICSQCLIHQWPSCPQ